MPDDLTPRISGRKLPPRILRNRELQAVTDSMDRERFEKAVEAHVRARATWPSMLS